MSTADAVVESPTTGPGTPEQRRKYIGGSDVAAVLGLSPWSTPLEVWEKKTGRYVEQYTPEQLARFARGHRWELPAFEMLCDELERRGHDVKVLERSKRYVHPDHDFLACEIDFEILFDGEHVNIEIKTVGGFSAKDWGDVDTDEIPIHYASQVMFGLGITKRRLCIVGALHGADNIVPYFIQHDPEIIDPMIEKCVDWWNAYVVTDIAPDPVNFEDMKRVMSKLRGRPIELNDDALDALRELERARALKSSCEAAEEAAQFRIGNFVRKVWELQQDQPIVGTAEFLYKGKKVGSWNTEVRRSVDLKKLEADYPEIKKALTVSKEIRVMRITKAKS